MMGAAMTERGEGERIEARRRRLFWFTLAIIAIGGAVVGFVTGFYSVGDELSPGDALASMSPGAVIAIVALGLVSFIYGCWRFLKVIDEVELADNLWGSTASFYAYATLFPTWWALWKGGVLGEPSDWAILLVALVFGGVVYAWRKWRAR